jgi:hypothetical protein
MTRTHFGQHDAGCFGCKLYTLSFNPTEHPASVKDRQWDKDMEAYRRLRYQGVQPRSIDGSAVLEKGAETNIEVEYGQVLTTAQRKQTVSLMADMP